MYSALPNKNLKDIFKSYHYVEIDTEQAKKNTGLIIEDGIFEFCFLKESDISIISGGKKIKLPQSFGFGKIEMPYKFIIPTTMTYLALKIQPWATSFFFNKDYISIIDLSKTLCPSVELLRNKIFSAVNFEDKTQLIEDFFTNENLPHPDSFKITKDICNYIYEKRGVIKIKALLEKFPYSRQKINEIFFEQTKNSIKEFAVYTRLRAITSYITNHPDESLTSIVYKFGYFDQSHFIKDMRRVSGITPSNFSKSDNLFFDQLKKTN